ncbi:alpha-tocopherol transfer protein-like isoform X2 [Bombyx mori]|uniref:CRAL/TRIO N-terminal domain-containing protein n=1 Tax=Bombyx mori TaxID=7091 RepID=A0A8R1WLZ1_BOMMO|nr:alpha-tocopherol transfer protein-like isoform X2 [Bombyx mori]
MSVRALPPELAEKARKELNEDPSRINSDIQHLKDWLSKQPHLRARTDDQWLLAFLRGCKYSLERTKEKLDLYYSVRTTAPELFSIKPSNPLFDEILSLGAILILPKTATSDSPRVSLIIPGRYDADKYNITDVMAVSFVLQKIIMMEDDNAIVAGILSILDLDTVKMGHFLQMTPMVMKKMVVASQLYVHNQNYEEMYKYIPKDILPVEYGGSGGSIEEIIDYWRKKVKEYSDWLEEDDQYGTDESKRPGKPKTAEDMFGVEGSFRQLEFD